MRARQLKARAMTLREWAALPLEVEGELVDGVLVEEEMATVIHDAIMVFLIRLFGWVDDRGGLVLPSDHKVAVTARRGRKPDVSVYLPGSRAPRAHDSVSFAPPDIAVEIITARPKDARRDRVDKVREYARFGIRWYWLIDPALRSVEVLELGPKHRYTVIASLSSGTMPVPGCRGLKLSVDKLWARVDKLD